MYYNVTEEIKVLITYLKTDQFNKYLTQLVTRDVIANNSVLYSLLTLREGNSTLRSKANSR
jgi:hypothetical protein